MKKIIKFCVSLSTVLILGVVLARTSLAQGPGGQGTGPGYYYCLNKNCVDRCNFGYETNCAYDKSLETGQLTCFQPTTPTECRPSAFEKQSGVDCVNTALGCIPINNPNQLAAYVMRWAFGIAGGIAILLIIAASFIIITSSGDPKKVQGGKELLTAAIAGVVLIIFSTFILRVIGVNILGIF